MTWYMSSMTFSSMGLLSCEMTGSLCKHTALYKVQGDGGPSAFTFCAMEEKLFPGHLTALTGPAARRHRGVHANLQRCAAISARKYV